MAAAAQRRRSSTPEPDRAEIMKVAANGRRSLSRCDRPSRVSGRTTSTLFRASTGGARGGPRGAREGPDPGSDPVPAVNQQNHQIGIAGTAPGGLDHGAVEVAARREDARRINEDDLAAPFDRNAAQPRSGGLNVVRDDPDDLPH